jgi:hypothetical protein
MNMSSPTQPTQDPFTESKLLTVLVYYNTDYWDLNIHDPEREHGFVSTLKIFHSIPGNQYHQIQFNWTPHQPTSPSHPDPLKPAYFQWAKQGKHPRQVVLFYRVCGPNNHTSHRLIAVATQSPDAYNTLKNRLVEAYLDWSLTGRLPVIGGSRS